MKGQALVELLLAIGLAAIILPAILTGLVATRSGRVQQNQRLEAITILKETQEAVRNVREAGWNTFAVNGTYHPLISGSSWSLASGSAVTNGYTQQIVLSDVYRDSSGKIATSGGTLDASTKKVEITISWTQPYASAIQSTGYVTRYLDNITWVQTTQAEFNASTLTQAQVTNTSGGEVTLGFNTKAKWCSPAFSSSTIDLPDGPPVAVDATASAATSIPNDVFVVTSPYATSSVKLAYVNVTANTDPPVSTLRGTFTLDSSKYSSPGYVPSGINLTNSFKTNDVKYYKSSSGKTYALMATDLQDHEIVVAQMNDGSGDAFQDPVNKIYKYWTFFNTRIYNPNAGLDTGFRNPSANASDTGGDNNGFQSNPTRAYSDNASFALDTDSGNGTGTSCTGADKDKHRYYNYGFALPGGTTINGIEVRLDAKVDNTTGSPQMCIQLSWDGGTTWTTAKSTATLTTSEATYILGGAADTWGRTWNDTNFTNTNFRLRVINVASNISRDFSLDWAAVKVYYSSGTATNDQAPFDYGGTTLTVLGNRGYTASGGYLYTFDLSNIDSKSPISELDQIGCRIQLDGYDCQPGSPASDKKYSAGQTGASWGDIGSAAHDDCSDGGNIELFATNDLSGVQVGGNNYIYVAVGAGTNPEFDIVNATSVPDGGSSPSINNSSCGRISGGNASWKMVGSKDFNSNSGTEEAANSVYAKSDGSRAYISSNGTTDSKQFYVLNTTNKSSPTFLNEPPATNVATSGFYLGTGANGEMYPRRSLTVLNGQRVVLVGKDGITNGNDAQEYQVLNSQTEATPTYCGGLNFDQGFNDLTSVTEADLDNFVYMVANTTINELKIIQGGPDGTYSSDGTIESPTFDAGYNTAFNNFTATTTIPANTNIGIQFAGADPVLGSCSGAVFSYVGPDGMSGTYYTTTGSAIFLGTNGSYKNPARCFRYKAFLSTTDFNTTPILKDIIVNYSP